MAKKKDTISSHQKREVEMVLKGAGLIKDSIRVVAAMQKCVNMESVDVITSATIAIGDTIVAFANATGEPTDKIQGMFVECLKEHISQTKAEARQNN